MTDEQLIREFEMTGASATLDVLVSRHIGRVRSMIYAMVLNDADADDLTQEVFLKAVRHLGRYRGRASFTTWLYRITMNTAKNFVRKRGRDKLELRDAELEQPDWRPVPSAQAMAHEEEHVLRGALARLPLRLRSAFSLVILQGMSPQEAAHVEGCFLSTIYRRVEAARRELAEAWRGVQ